MFQYDLEKACPHVAVVKALAHLQTHFRERVTLAELARVARVSPSHLSRLFVAALGESPHRALVSCRLEYARSLLEQGKAAAMVALEAGFADQAHLSRLFKRRFGTTPSRCSRSNGAAGGSP